MTNTIIENNLNTDYILYTPLSQKGDETTYVHRDIAKAQEIAKNNIPLDIRNNWDHWVSTSLKVEQTELFSSFSSEQIDSIGIGILNFNRNIPFLVADETGVGKGRILAGLTHYALKNNRKVIFFTEREHLHSEFWRDLTDTNTLPLLKDPTLYHTTAEIYNINGDIVLKGKQKTINEIEENGFSKDCNFIFTNYSQISLKNHKKTKKNAILNFIDQNTLIILDECHNATGESNTKDFILDILSKSADKKLNTVFSSATFIKDESQLDLYKDLLSFDKETLNLLKKLLSNKEFDTSLLRKNITLELTKKLRLWRREHEPINVAWNHIECQNKDYINECVDLYSNFILTLFKLNKDIAEFIEHNPQSNKSIPSAEKIKKNWFNLGSTVNRYTKNLLFILKSEETVQQILQSLKRNHKPVIVIDSTLSSLLKDTDAYNKEHNSSIEEQYINPFSFGQALKSLAEKAVGNIITALQQSSKCKSIDNVILSYQHLLKQANGELQNLILSPIDYIKHRLNEYNVTLGEISGRKFQLDIKSNKIVKMPKIVKFKTVADFNHGNIEAIIITRAGASGISLHASKLFKNQDTRDLFELDITSRPSYRVQFLGRVNRKNQSKKPEYYAITTHLPFEQRILNKENIKLTTIQTHISGQKEKFKQNHILNLYTQYINKNILSLLQHNKVLAQQCGIFLGSSNDNNEDPYYYIDSLLKRSIILPINTQERIFEYLQYCTQAELMLKNNKYEPIAFKISKILQFSNYLDQKNMNKFKERFSNNPLLSFNQYDFKYTSALLIENGYHMEENDLESLQEELKDNKANTPPLSKESIIATLKADNLYNTSYLHKHVIPLIEKIKIGTQIKLDPDSVEHNEFIMGYVNNIYYTPENFNFENLDATIIEIVNINPTLQNSIHNPLQKSYITLRELLNNESAVISNLPIVWNNYTRKKQNYIRNKIGLTGQPVLIEFYRQAYGMGEIKELTYQNNNFVCLILPPQFNTDNIKKLPKPFFNVYDIVNSFHNGVKCVSSIWQQHNNIKDGLLLKKEVLHKEVFYHLYIANEIKDIILDFPMQKILKPYFKQSQSGYLIYLIPNKVIFKILFMLDVRSVTWFVKQ